MKDPPKNRRALMDIGVAGPWPGMAVSVVVMMIGLSLSHLDALPAAVSQGQIWQLEGNSLLYLFLKYLRFGQLLPAPASYGGVSPLLYWVRYFSPVSLHHLGVQM